MISVLLQDGITISELRSIFRTMLILNSRHQKVELTSAAHFINLNPSPKLTLLPAFIEYDDRNVSQTVRSEPQITINVVPTFSYAPWPKHIF